MDQRLRQVPLFAQLSDEDLERICRGVEDRHLEPGETLFAEGDHGDMAYVVVDGEVEILKATGRRQTLIAVRGPREVIGEMAVLQEEPRTATVRARTGVDLLTIPKAVLDALFATSPTAARSIFSILLDRLQETNNRQRQSDRMAQLGTLTAGVAHELNNPAAGAQRAAERLVPALEDLAVAVADARALSRSTLEQIATAAAQRRAVHLAPLQRSDAEAALEDWLDERDIEEAWSIAPALVESGFDVPDVAVLTQDLDAEGAAAAVGLLAALVMPRRLAHDIAAGTARISEIVERLKSHAYLDRAPVQDVDVHKGLDDTLALLAHKLDGITVVRDYGDDVPTITAAGGELNQVWTNVLDNAAYELAEAGGADPCITIRTRREGDEVVVEIEDNGRGIPEESRERIFDAFYTTKPPGAGTGQGLNLSYQVVVLDHEGELTAQSAPGRTVFRVAVPIERPA